MWEEILKAIPVYLSSTLKFILGPSMGYGERLHPVTTILATVAGMMTSVTAFTYFGEWIRTKVLHRFFLNRKRFTPKTRKFVLIWRKYGLTGVAILTPLILTPIGGTILAVSAGSPKERIFLFMLISAFSWAILFTVAIYFFGHQFWPDFVK
jgi:membrane protein DedA with SNARE-associated domain